MITAFCRFVLRHRWLVLALLLGTAVFMGSKAREVVVASRTTDVFPATHPYVETFAKYSDIFGGASKVLVSVEVKNGTIWNQKTLREGAAHHARHGADARHQQLPGHLARAAQGEGGQGRRGGGHALGAGDVARRAQHAAGASTTCSAPSWARVATTARWCRSIRRPPSSRAASSRTSCEPKVIYKTLDDLVKKESDENTVIQVIGRPMLLGDIATQSPRLGLIMLVTIVSMLMRAGHLLPQHGGRGRAHGCRAVLGDHGLRFSGRDQTKFRSAGAGHPVHHHGARTLAHGAVRQPFPR